MPTITAAVCTCDRRATLSDTIDSLRQQTLSADQYEVLVVDNSIDAAQVDEGSHGTNGTPNVRFEHVSTQGLSYARNAALELAMSPLVAFIDDDAIANRDWLAELVAVFESEDSSVAAVGGPARPVWEVPRPNWLHENFLGYVGVLDLGNQRIDLGGKQWLIGTNVAYRVRDAREAGGFSTLLGRQGGLLLSNEELDMQSRLRARGHRIIYTPAAVVDHHVQAERLTQTWLRRRIFWQVVCDQIEQELRNHPGQSPNSSDASDASPRRFRRQCDKLHTLIGRLGRGEPPPRFL